MKNTRQSASQARRNEATHLAALKAKALAEAQASEAIATAKAAAALRSSTKEVEHVG